MYKVKITEIIQEPVFPEGPPSLREIVLLEQTLEKLNLRAVFDALNPPKRSHRRKEKQP